MVSSSLSSSSTLSSPTSPQATSTIHQNKPTQQQYIPNTFTDQHLTNLPQEPLLNIQYNSQIDPTIQQANILYPNTDLLQMQQMYGQQQHVLNQYALGMENPMFTDYGNNFIQMNMIKNRGVFQQPYRHHRLAF